MGYSWNVGWTCPASEVVNLCRVRETHHKALYLVRFTHPTHYAHPYRCCLQEPMTNHICPWWGGYFIDNPLRRLLHDPEQIVGPYVQPGMTVMDVGCGMGIFSVAMAKMVGGQGRVIAVDLQQQMLDVVGRRAALAGVADRILLHRCEPDRLGVEVQVDFALAFAMIHEAPDARRLLGEIYGCLKPGGKLFAAEPRVHVRRWVFDATVTAAEELGFSLLDQPHVRLCRAAVLQKE
jgi:2-polyprenyl-3-methyl-5-hydroxy-6-metoxy-1,4-benzoquinol methylase